MAELIHIRQTLDLKTLYEASYSGVEEGLQPVSDLHELTPYGLMLSALGSCTAQVVNTFAKNHDYPLEEVRITLKYERVFNEDCENCETIDRYTETIFEEIAFAGDLSEQQRSRLEKVAHLCPIYQQYRSGIKIQTDVQAP